MTYEAWVSVDGALWWAAFVSNLGITVSALEDLVRPGPFRDDGLLSWKVMRLERPALVRGIRSRLAHLVFDYRRFRVLLVVRLLASLWLGVALWIASPSLPVLPLCLVWATTVALSLRTAHGLDGAHQMWIVTFGALFTASLFPPGDPVRFAAASFLAAQLALSYLVAGFAKLASPLWRSGMALTGILGTSVFGHPGIHRFLARRPFVSRMAAWGAMGLECAFVIVFVVPSPFQHGLLALGVAFHVAIAFLMGLNNFLFAFAGAYPVVAFCAHHSNRFFMQILSQ